MSLFAKEIGFLFDKQEKLKKSLSEVKIKTTSRGFLDVFPPESVYKITDHCNKESKSLGYFRSTIHQSKRKKGSISREKIKGIAEFTDNQELMKLLNSNIVWDRIESIECIGEHQVYDIAMEDSHNFIANNVYVHNTFAMQEFIVQALTHRLKVLYVSLEGTERNLNMRIYRRIAGLGNEEGSEIIYPTFDCMQNQLGICGLPQRTNEVALRDSDSTPLPEFTKANPYRPCTACREERGSGYVPATWFEILQPPPSTMANTIRKVAGFGYMYGRDNLRTINYPRFGASVSDINRELNMLELIEGFIPDVIVVDYADILKPEKIAADRFGIDEIWKMLSAMSAERRALVITASQGNRGSLHKSNVEDTDLAEWIGKLGHVDLFCALHQTKEEKRLGVIRWGVLAHRHQDFDPDRNVIVLQNLRVGQQNLDSHMSYVSS